MERFRHIVLNDEVLSAKDGTFEQALRRSVTKILLPLQQAFVRSMR
jgi:hypothetical protein